ncbi:RES family NAD+ phosphorylase [Sphingomonas sp. HH69]
MVARATMPVATIAAGQTLHRVHGASVPARWYGRKDATWRWDDPQGRYGVLYLGKSLTGPFAESLLRTPADRAVLWDRVQQKRAAAFVTTRTMRLAKLHGPGLAWFQTTAAGVSADFDPAIHRDAYATTQTISALVHAETALDGIQYRSRIDTDQLCVALFERADSAIGLVTENLPIGKDWTRKILKPRGYELIEL